LSVGFIDLNQLILTLYDKDSTIDFEKRRNVPVRYDRELVQTTITAMKRIGEIKQRREHAFWKQRFLLS
jgi:large subunit ribosomal protein L24e